MRGNQIARNHAPFLFAIVLSVAAVGGCSLLPPNDHYSVPYGMEDTLIVTQAEETLLRPLTVVEPQEPRWRDIGDAPYSDEFRESFSYRNSERHRVRVTWESDASALSGTVNAVGLKPWFAYQLKLMGAAPIAGSFERDNLASPEQWSSFQLGRVGRWWCEDCQWNVGDGDLRLHIQNDHTVHGYVLFDWFVTDGSGDAEHTFALVNSLRVLWRVDQRERSAKDTHPRWYELARSPQFYPPTYAEEAPRFAIFGEWEPGRADLGEASLPAGRYAVNLNITEETFHANLDEARELAGGGFWAQVLEAAVEFEVLSH